MRDVRLTVPQLSLIAATRAALGAGLAFLCADCISRERRSAIGWTLVAIGALSTIPLAFEVFGRERPRAEGTATDQATDSLHTAHGALRPRKAFVW
jgi:hypothetical protein